MGDKTILRIPVLENIATQYGNIFSVNSRMLSPAERNTVETIFLQSVNYDLVRVVTSSVAAAPTTFGNHIRILPGYDLTNDTLVHEMTHIWQFQTRGNSYISDSLVNQTVAIITHGDRNAAYTYTIVPGQSIGRYNAEQQAMIVENYFLTPSLKNDPDYLRLIDEIRRARPVLTDMGRYEESLYGTQYQNQRFFDPATRDNIRPTETVPIFRLEF